MKNLTNLFRILFWALALTPSSAQMVHFAHGSEILPENIKSFHAPAEGDPDVMHNAFVRYVQFAAILTTDQRKALEDHGLVFIGYVNFGAYLTIIPDNFEVKKLETYGAKSIITPAPQWKMHQKLKERPFGDWAVHGNQIDISLQVYPCITIQEGAALARKNGMTVLETGTQNGYLCVRIDQEKIETVAALPFVQWMEQIAEPSKKEDLGGRSLHRANLLDSDHPLGKKYNGTGVNILVRDDGAVGPHIDFQGRLFNQDGVGAPTNGTHGDGVAGIIGGAGNLDPAKKGMSAGADVYVINYSSEFQDETLPLLLDNNVTITNTSYSNGCNDGYTVASQTVDEQIYEHPTLMHVFSAGNSNGSDCAYGAGNQWGNITGGHKMAKNAIATANLRVDGVIETSSSRGPAHDGRIKPDISANGTSQNSTSTGNTYQVFGGTSAAAPGIAGCLGQLTQAYKTINNTTEAPTALLKLAILNTANDLGNTGPDFKFGWGHINNYLALQLLEQGRYVAGSIGQGEQNTHNVTIPASTKQAKLMIYWVDPPANVDAARALLNDLDITVAGPTGTVYHPWKLNPTPDPVLLDTPAGVGRDSLNNMEQVSLVNPAAGVYNVRVKGFEVPFGPQPYYLAWEFLNDNIKLTYPSGGESFVPGTKEWIRWDAYGNTSAFTLKYSTNGGMSYTTISSPANSGRMLEWTVPAVTSGNVKLVITRGTTSDTTQFPLTIVPQPSNLIVQKVCPDSATLQWTSVADLTLKYDAFQLGQKYMELKGTSAAGATLLTIPITSPVNETWFSIRANRNDGLIGRRINAVNWPGGLLGCPQGKDLSVSGVLSPSESLFTSCGPVTKTVSFSVKNDGTLPATGAMATYQLNNFLPVTQAIPVLQPGQVYVFTFNTPVVIDQNGLYQLNISVSLNGEIFTANNITATNFQATVVPVNAGFTQDFENGALLPDGWSVDNPDNGITWKRLNGVTGSDGNATQALFVNHYSYSEQGQEDYLYFPPLDLANITQPFLAFDYSHAQYNSSYIEQLKVEVFPNCDLTATPVVVWEKSDPELGIMATTASFTPSAAADWQKDGVSLEQFAGQTVIVRFNAVNDYGNNTFLDNVAIQDRAQPVAVLNALNSNCAGTPMVYTANNSPGENNQYAWSFGPNAIPTSATGKGPHQVIYTSAGSSLAQLIVSNAFGADTTSQVVQVSVNPVSLFVVSTNGDIAQFNNQSQATTNWLWEFGDNSTSTLENPEHTYAANGTYIATLTVSNNCGQSTYTQTIQVVTDLSASFTAAATGSCAPVNVQFSNTSTANATTFLWEFPGGIPATSTLPNPLVVYNSPGVFAVTLTVGNGFSTSTIIEAGLVTVMSLPEALFAANITGSGVAFENITTGGNTYLWNFGDGTTETAVAPAHIYPGDGTYTVTLTAGNDCGISTATQAVTITTPPTADFQASQYGGCETLTVSFENLSSANATAFDWSFPGGTPSFSTESNPQVTYTMPGIYTVVLTATNASGVSTSTQQEIITVTANPTAVFTVQTAALTAAFTNMSSNAVSYQWDFSDGTTSTDENPVHIFSAAGNYEVTLTVTNDCGSKFLIQEITVGSMVTAQFSVDGPTTGCAPFVVHFTDLSTGNPDYWQWIVTGIGGSYAAQNPTITFTQPGVYDITLLAGNIFGESTSIQNSQVTVTPLPFASFNLLEENGVVSFMNQSNNATSYTWIFGDGSPESTAENPVHTYATPGSYSVYLLAINDCDTAIFVKAVLVTVGTSALPDWVTSARIYPNPNTGTFTLELAGLPQETLELELLNSLGQVIRSDSGNSNSGKLRQIMDYGNLPAGTYSLKVNSGLHILMIKVLIEK
jgi:PKD repeat protein